MPSIKLKSLKFDHLPFRKLTNLSIPIAERITIIAGHNGIGKSTILGLIANGSGISSASIQSYLNRSFDANLNEIVHLDYAKEYEAYKSINSPLPMPFLEYEIDGETLLKKCTPTSRVERREVRVVVRNDPHKEMLSQSGTIRVGPDAKVPLPTLYLGMTRMLPVGESDPKWITSTIDNNIHKDDADFIQKFIASVIGTGQASPSGTNITTQGIKGTKKTAKHPEYPYSPKCVSLGQDSLSAIATAVASFKKLKREWTDYPGGLLVIDEIDAGFHPHAQKALIKALSNAAKIYDLQILATTHSVCLIESIHPDANPIGATGKRVDGVVYLTDTKKPRLTNGYSLQDIQRDMSLIPPPVLKASKPKILKIYLEDPEANFFMTRLLTPALKRRVKREAGVGLKAIPMSTGCGNLTGFVKHDPYFRTVLIVLDADAPITGKQKDIQNIVRLPSGEGKNSVGLSPERSLHEFIKSIANKDGKYPNSEEHIENMKLSSDYLVEHFLKGASTTKRESAKKWMNSKIELITQWKIVELWLKEHPSQVKAFENRFITAAIATAKEL